jgi:hypothetical protein
MPTKKELSKSYMPKTMQILNIFVAIMEQQFCFCKNSVTTAGLSADFKFFYSD